MPRLSCKTQCKERGVEVDRENDGMITLKKKWTGLDANILLREKKKKNVFLSRKGRPSGQPDYGIGKVRPVT